ncbi:integrin alpha-PS5 [Anabrus simplex]|uniref:integrin alpha-PS5 n=1 Tax=Anabrus simplex TaxID=316456 RepID=UPI0035A2DC05
MSNAMGDEGCVYMFITDKETGWKKTGEPNRLMGLKQHGARFGYAISVLGDINMDSYPDVAIGAPYEDDSRGVVYLYLGSKDGLNLEYSQRLVAQEIDSNLRGFGSSISRGFDVDENYYNDLAIGAYPSNNVVLVKTYPIVTMEPEFIPSVSKIGFNDTEFNASACVTYSGRHAPSKIDVAITVRADPLYKRAHFLSGGKEFSYNVTLEYGGDRDCRNFTFVIGGLKEHYKPFDISMDYKLHSQKKRASDTSESFCKDCPVLNETKVHWWKVPYGLGCKEDTSCSIDLDMKASFMNVRSPFVIGTEEFVSFQMELENKNDPAYLSKISIIFPRATQHRRLPVDCRENGTAEFKNHLVQLVCDVDGPLNQGNKYNLTLELDMKNVPLSMHQLEINVTAISSDVDSDESNNHVQLILPLQADFNVAVNGLSVPEQFAFASRKKDSDVEVIQDKDFTHTFQINNKGPTPVNSLSLDFKIPYSVYIGKKFVDILDVSLPLVEMQRQHLFCKVDKHSDVVQEGVVRSLPNRQAAEIEDVSSNRTLLLDCSLKHVRCVDVKCVMDRQFVKKTSVIVSFPIKTKLQQSESLIVNKDRVIATSSCLARLTETEIREKMVQITMWRAFPDTGVAWWIYFLAILAGILVLAGIIWCCYKRGFFRRDMHMQLQAMKQPSLVEQEFLSENSDT